jgi:gliding motility-associated-like protein
MKRERIKLLGLIRYLFFACCLLSAVVGKAQQPVADFSVNTTEGCLPLQVAFKDLSTGTPKFWNWDFGNGQLSNQQNPNTVYYSPGKYTVKLVVRNADGTNGITKTDYITINPSPTAEFESDKTTACQFSDIQFFNKSIPNAGTIVKYEWDFGDGTTSSEENPKKAYTANGFYTINLRITSSTGCTGSRVSARYIRVVSGVTANFRDTISRVCRAPFITTFNNESSGPGTLSYQWTFGDGKISTDASPVNPYTAPGTYNVNLITKSDLGCADTVRKAVVITGSLTTFNSPDNSCLNQPVTFQNTSAPPALSTVWDFGDGTSSNQASPVKTFTVAGNYRVRLLSTYASCVDSVIKNFVVNAAAPIAFSSNVPGACRGPVAVSFTNESPNVATARWDFGDGGTSTAINPQHTYTSAGTYNVTLTITNTSGCTATLTKNGLIRIAPPVPTIANAPSGGCIPFTFAPVANVDAVDPIVSYVWDFGDGSSTVTGSNPVHVYTNTGTYTLNLTVTTAGGCTNTVTIPNGVKTGTPPVAAFTANRVQSCVDSVISFTNQSTPAGLEFLWEFGDTTTSKLANPVKRYTDTTGVFTVKLTASNNGCERTETKTNYISVLPPLARFNYYVDCGTRPGVRFANASRMDPTQPATYSWEFGDPLNSKSTQENPTFTYPAAGKYTVTFTVTQGGCANRLVFEISAQPEVADFRITPRDTVCRNSVVTFLSQGSDPQNVVSYQWSIDNGAYLPFGKDLSTQINKNGRIPVSLVVTDRNNCTDTITRYIVQTGPFAAFTASDTAGCINKTITFTDGSASDSAIISWRMDYGDGTVQTYTNKGPFVHQYKAAGKYTVVLKVTSRGGCTDSLIMTNLIRISKPVAGFFADTEFFCKGGIVRFTDSSINNGKLTYLWNFGDRVTSTDQNPTHSYSGNDSVYNVSLKVVDSLGCADSLTKVAFITTKNPKAAFAVKDSVSICPPLETTFTLRATNYESFYWDFGDGSTSTRQDPNHFYNTYGKYDAKLVVVGKGGCLDSIQYPISLVDPRSSSITYSPLNACNSLLVDFTVVPPPSVASTFLFGDGTQGSLDKPSFQHFYSTPNFYLPSLFLKDSLQCEVYVNGNEYIRIIGAEPLFSLDKKAFCDSGTVYFTDYTLGNDPVQNYVWNFGNGVTTSDKEPIYNFNQPGQYLVSLTVNTVSGCSKTATDTVRVYPTPMPSIGSADVVCINSPLDITGTLAQPDSTVKWTWTFGNGGLDSSQNPSTRFATPGRYTLNVQAENALGCKTLASKQVVALALPQINVPAEPTISLGSGISIPVTYSPGVSGYSWTPARDLSCTNCAAPIANPKLTTTYTVVATDTAGCTSTKDITIRVECNSNNYFVPNTFTPNGDGTNDVFFPRGTSLARVQSMRIFNRWGQMVFERRNFPANSAADGWDGRFNGKNATSDAYVYIVEFICDNGLIVPFKGNVTLIR